MRVLDQGQKARRKVKDMMTAAAKKDTTKSDVKAVVQPQPAPAPVVAAQVAAIAPSKQQVTLETLKAAWTKRGVDLGKMKVRQDGKFILVTVGAGWPEIKIGPSGGGDIPAIKSFAKFADAAVIADELLAKQLARASKEAAPATSKPVAQQKKEPAAETPAAKKSAQHKELEQKLQAQA